MSIFTDWWDNTFGDIDVPVSEITFTPQQLELEKIAMERLGMALGETDYATPVILNALGLVDDNGTIRNMTEPEYFRSLGPGTFEEDQLPTQATGQDYLRDVDTWLESKGLTDNADAQRFKRALTGFIDSREMTGEIGDDFADRIGEFVDVFTNQGGLDKGGVEPRGGLEDDLIKKVVPGEFTDDLRLGIPGEGIINQPIDEGAVKRVAPPAQDNTLALLKEFTEASRVWTENQKQSQLSFRPGEQVGGLTQAQKLYRNLQSQIERQTRALEGDLPVSEGLRQAREKEQGLLTEELARQGARPVSTAGIQSQAEFDKRFDVREDFERRAEIQTGQANIGRSLGLLSNERDTRITQLANLPRRHLLQPTGQKGLVDRSKEQEGILSRERTDDLTRWLGTVGTGLIDRFFPAPKTKTP